MNKRPESVAETAAYLADDEKIKEQVEQEIACSKMVTWLVQLRIQKKVTQKQIAEYIKCDPSKISKIEAGNDFQLKWMDIVGYLFALGVRPSILVEDTSLPAASRIKQHVFAIHTLLEELANLAEEVGDDTRIVDKIHQFYGEVLFNFLAKFGDSNKKLVPFVNFAEPQLMEGNPVQKEMTEGEIAEKTTSSNKALC